MRREVVALVEAKLREYPQLQGSERSGALLWCAVIEEALEEQRKSGRPERARMVELRYFSQKTEEQVQEQLPVSRSCYLKWRQAFIGTVAAKAAWHRLIKP